MFPYSNFIILSFDVTQNNENILSEIKLNEQGSTMLWVKLIFPALDYLEVLFEFEGKTLIADATELVQALVELQAKIRSTSTPVTPRSGSLTSFFDRMITTHLTHHLKDTQRMMQDPEVTKLKIFERNPDLTRRVVAPPPALLVLCA